MRFQLVTTRSPEHVFHAVADFSRLAEWDPFVSKSEIVHGSPLQVGSRYRLTAPRGLTLEYEIEEVSEPVRIVYRGGTSRVTSIDTISIDRVGEDTGVTIQTVIEFEGWTFLIAPFVRFAVWLGSRFFSLPAMRRSLGA